jgi:hypothetical protein
MATCIVAFVVLILVTWLWIESQCTFSVSYLLASTPHSHPIPPQRIHWPAWLVVILMALINWYVTLVPPPPLRSAYSRKEKLFYRHLKAGGTFLTLLCIFNKFYQFFTLRVIFDKRYLPYSSLKSLDSSSVGFICKVLNDQFTSKVAGNTAIDGVPSPDCCLHSCCCCIPMMLLLIMFLQPLMLLLN